LLLIGDRFLNITDYLTVVYHLERLLAVPDDMVVTVVTELKGKIK
jgi:hypothetical protein